MFAASQPLVMPALFDQNKLLERCMGNNALMQKLLMAFLNSLPIEQESLDEAVRTEDWSSVARISHKLRGTALNMCATPLSEAALQVEVASRANPMDCVAHRCIDLNQQIEMLRNALTMEALEA
jgi:HPt (histidine-containing phosphotransfer) domain-containing protein